MVKLIIDNNNEGQRLNKYLGKYLDNAPSGFIYKMLRKKNIKYNGGKASGSEIVHVGDVIEIYLADETISKFKKSFDNDIQLREKRLKSLKDIEIIYEDDDILILNKPVGILSQKARPEDYSLNEQIIDYYNIRENVDKMFTPSVCNRLDRNTSGVILAGMSYQGTRILSKMLKNRTIDKYYLTVVKGKINEPALIKGFLTKKETHNQVVIYSSKEEAIANGIDSPAYIETAFTPIKCGRIIDGKRSYDVTLLKVELITGKTHQIRAHLRSIGHPVIGDGKYGHKDINAFMRREYGLKHQLLHAYEVHFPVDIDKLSMELSGKIFKAELTKEFQNICDGLF